MDYSVFYPGVVNPSEPVYEENVENHTQVTEGDSKIPNQSPKDRQVPHRCKKVDDTGVFCGKTPWDICDQKATSLQYLRDWGVRVFKSKHPHFLIEKEPMKNSAECWINFSSEHATSSKTDSYFSFPNIRKENWLNVFTAFWLSKPKIVVSVMKRLPSFVTHSC